MAFPRIATGEMEGEGQYLTSHKEGILMALSDMFSNLHLLMRWLHVIAGITWIGHLYFFNFVNVPLQAALDDAGKKAANPKLMPRALWWFRWGAMLTFLFGLILF